MITQKKFIKTLKGRPTSIEEIGQNRFPKYIQDMTRKYGSLRNAAPNMISDYLNNHTSLDYCSFGEITRIQEGFESVEAYTKDLRKKSHENLSHPLITRNCFDYYHSKGFKSAKFFKMGDLLLITHYPTEDVRQIFQMKDGMNLSNGKYLLDNTQRYEKWAQLNISQKNKQ